MTRHTIHTWKSRHTSWTLVSFLSWWSRWATLPSFSFFSWNPNRSRGSQGPYWSLWSQWSWVTPRPLLRKTLADRAVSSSTGAAVLLATPIFILYSKEDKY